MPGINNRGPGRGPGESITVYGAIAALIVLAALAGVKACQPGERPCPPAQQQADGTFVIPAGDCATLPVEETNTLVDRDLNGPDQ